MTPLRVTPPRDKVTCFESFSKCDPISNTCANDESTRETRELTAPILGEMVLAGTYTGRFASDESVKPPSVFRLRSRYPY